MDGTAFIAYADRLRRQARDPSLIEFLDHAIGLARKHAVKSGTFDRNTYQRELMRKRRAEGKAEKRKTDRDIPGRPWTYP